MKRFALIGVAGYVAPRHLEAIKATGNLLVAAMDPNDSVGILDSYFPSAAFFTQFERFDRHLEKLKRSGEGVDYVVVCSPNYLHDAHIRFGFRLGADVICEKPLVLNPWNVDGLKTIEQETGRKVYSILQLRLHERTQQLKKEITSNPDRRYKVKLDYITARGQWYHYSWKGAIEKSGGIATNIGIHFFDMLQWIFGDANDLKVLKSTPTNISGKLNLALADVEWNLSIDENDLPKSISAAGTRTYRSLSYDGQEVRFDDGFDQLHIKSYENILAGHGFGINETVAAIKIVHQIRNQIVN